MLKSTRFNVTQIAVLHVLVLRDVWTTQRGDPR
jgi:hypothetical protein